MIELAAFRGTGAFSSSGGDGSDGDTAAVRFAVNGVYVGWANGDFVGASLAGDGIPCCVLGVTVSCMPCDRVVFRPCWCHSMNVCLCDRQRHVASAGDHSTGRLHFAGDRLILIDLLSS